MLAGCRASTRAAGGRQSGSLRLYLTGISKHTPKDLPPDVTGPDLLPSFIQSATVT